MERTLPCIELRVKAQQRVADSRLFHHQDVRHVSKFQGFPFRGAVAESTAAFVSLGHFHPQPNCRDALKVIRKAFRRDVVSFRVHSSGGYLEASRLAVKHD